MSLERKQARSASVQKKASSVFSQLLLSPQLNEKSKENKVIIYLIVNIELSQIIIWIKTYLFIDVELNSLVVTWSLHLALVMAFKES